MLNTKEERRETQAKRHLIIDRDNGECVVCGCSEVALLEVHHVHPLYLGGNSANDNLITLCTDCHFIVPHEVHKLGNTYEAFHTVFKRFVYLMQSKQRATLIQEMLLDWNGYYAYGWGDVRDINITCRKVMGRLAVHKHIQVNVEPPYDVDLVISEVIKEFA